MASYIFPENPEYITAIRQLESTDPANTALFNDLFEKLIENTHAVKIQADNKSDLGHTHSPGDCGLGKNLALTGAATGTYNGQAAKIVLIPDRKGCRFIVGTSTAGWTEKDCDYLCDGTADQVEINNAINVLPSTGGEIVVLAGTYNIKASITVNKPSVKLRGNGNATVLKRMWSGTTANGVIQVTDGNCCVEGFYINGNKTSYTNSYNYGINMSSSNNNTISGNICNNNKIGINTLTSHFNNITGNTVYRESYTSNQYSIWITQGNNNLIADNLIWGKNYANSGTNNTFVNNKYN